MNKIPRKEAQRYFQTLTLAAKILEGHNTVIDLLDDSYIVGQIKNVDGFMNIDMVNAVWCDGSGNEYGFENIFVKNRNIRFVHIPERLSLIKELQTGLEKLRRPFVRPSRGRNLKTTRAMRYTQQIVKDAYAKD